MASNSTQYLSLQIYTTLMYLRCCSAAKPPTVIRGQWDMFNSWSVSLKTCKRARNQSSTSRQPCTERERSLRWLAVVRNRFRSVKVQKVKEMISAEKKPNLTSVSYYWFKVSKTKKMQLTEKSQNTPFAVLKPDTGASLYKNSTQHIFNLGLNLESVPSLWKISCVVPAPKIALTSETNHFRPAGTGSPLVCILTR